MKKSQKSDRDLRTEKGRLWKKRERDREQDEKLWKGKMRETQTETKEQKKENLRKRMESCRAKIRIITRRSFMDLSKRVLHSMHFGTILRSPNQCYTSTS